VQFPRGKRIDKKKKVKKMADFRKKKKFKKMEVGEIFVQLF